VLKALQIGGDLPKGIGLGDLYILGGFADALGETFNYPVAVLAEF